MDETNDMTHTYNQTSNAYVDNLMNTCVSQLSLQQATSQIKQANKANQTNQSINQ